MGWFLHKKKGEELYGVWSSVVDDYVFEFNTRKNLQKNLENYYKGEAIRRAEEFMLRVDEVVE